MNKAELIEELAKRVDVSKAKATAALEHLLAIISAEIAKGESVALIGFGTFKSAVRAAREGRNPATGAKIKIPSAKLPKFSAGASLKALVAGKKAAPKKAAPKKAAATPTAKPAAKKPAAKPAAKKPAAKPAPKKK